MVTQSYFKKTASNVFRFSQPLRWGLFSSLYTTFGFVIVLLLLSVYSLRFWFPHHVNDTPFLRFSVSPRILVVCYRDGCGCDRFASEWCSLAQKRGIPVIVVGSKDTTTYSRFKKYLASFKINAVETTDQNLIRSLSPKGKTTLSEINFGFIGKQATGEEAAKIIFGKTRKE